MRPTPEPVEREDSCRVSAQSIASAIDAGVRPLSQLDGGGR
jgi:hypothetical protein